MNRFLRGGAALLLLLGSHSLVPAPESARRPGIGSVLGPLRPIVAELRLLALSLRVEEHRTAAALADAEAIVALRPDLPELWEELCFRLCLDLPGYESDPSRRGAWTAVGLEFRQQMIERFPNRASVRRTASRVVLSPLQFDPARLEAAGWSQAQAYGEGLHQALEALRCSGESEPDLLETQELLRSTLALGADPALSLSPEQRAASVSLFRELGFGEDGEVADPLGPGETPEDSSD